jgi:hypothetical protein
VDRDFHEIRRRPSRRTNWTMHDATSRILQDAMERGDLVVVGFILDNCETQAGLLKFGSQAMLAEAETWRRSAEEHEALHGAGSRLDPRHPFNRDVLPHLERHCSDPRNSSRMPWLPCAR